jgi:hypothetical protein
VMRSIAASAAMTVSQHLEMAATGRPPSDYPVRVVEAVTRHSVPNPARSSVGHVAQAVLAAAALTAAYATRNAHPVPAVALTTAALVTGDAALGMAVGVGGAPWRWQARDLVIDAIHKGAVSVAARALARRPTR